MHCCYGAFRVNVPRISVIIHIPGHASGPTGRALGYHVIGGSAAFLFTPVAALWLATVLRSWRSSFFILALPALVSGLILWLGTEEIRRDSEKAQSATGNPKADTGDRCNRG